MMEGEHPLMRPARRGSAPSMSRREGAARRRSKPNDHESGKFGANLDGILMPGESIANAFFWLDDGKVFSPQWKGSTQQLAQTEKKGNWALVHNASAGTDRFNWTYVPPH
jgi:hypothetical protein